MIWGSLVSWAGCDTTESEQGEPITSWKPNTIACLLHCQHAGGVCVFSSPAQPRHNCLVTWAICSWLKVCALLPTRLQGPALIPPEPKQHLRWGMFPNLFSRLKKAGVPFGADLLWGLTAVPLCSVKENEKSGKAFENRRFLPFPPVDKMTQPELRRLPAPGTELLPPIPVYRGRCDSGTFPRSQRHCRGESHTE